MNQYNVTVDRVIRQKAVVKITAHDEICARRGVQSMIDFYPHEIKWEFNDEDTHILTAVQLTDQ